MRLRAYCLPRVRPGAWLAGCACALAAAFSLAACARVPTLQNTRETPRAVAEAVIAALDDKNIDALTALAVDEEEFRVLVWPQLPAARPERNLTWQYVWQDLSTKSRYHARARQAAWSARGARVVQVRFDGPVEDHGTYRIHRETVIDLRRPDGQQSTERLFGSMIEQAGRFKVFSYVVD